MTSRYAAATSVTEDRSKQEIERTLRRYGASRFAYGWTEAEAVLSFTMRGRAVRFSIPMPSPDDFRLAPGRRLLRSPKQQRDAYDQAVRQRWRAAKLFILAMLEAVAARFLTFEDAFLAHILTEGGQTVGEWIAPRFDHAALDQPPTPILLPAARER